MINCTYMLRRSFLAIAGVLTVLLFQQCGQLNNFQKVAVVESPSQSQSTEVGNGDGYTGKLFVAQGVCDSKPFNISSKIMYNKELSKARMTRDHCVDLDPGKELTVTDFVFLQPDLISFRYNGEMFNPENQTSSEVLETTTQSLRSTEEFNLNDSRACAGAGYCSCGTRNVLYGCAASDGVPDRFCQGKGFVKAQSWTCARGPAARICDYNGDCYQNQNPGNSICDKVICTN